MAFRMRVTSLMRSRITAREMTGKQVTGLGEWQGGEREERHPWGGTIGQPPEAELGPRLPAWPREHANSLMTAADNCLRYCRSWSLAAYSACYECSLP